MHNLLLAILTAASAVLISFTMLSRAKKAQIKNLGLLKVAGHAYSELHPEGSVVINGEVWRARSGDGGRIAQGQRVMVTTVQQHLLVVEPV